MKSFVKKHSLLLSFSVLVLGAVFFCAKFLFPLDTVIFEESYLQQCSYLDINIFSLIYHGRIPCWAFHFGGGYPFIQHPENISLSPLFYLLVLPFGSACGMKLMILFSYFTGILGMLLFTRKVLKYNIPASLLSSSMFIFSSFIPFQINTGNTRDQGWMWLPLLLFLTVKARDNIRFVLYSALIIVLLILSGFNLYIAPLFLFFFIYALLEDISRDKPGDRSKTNAYLTVSFLMILITSFLLGAVKLIPVLKLLFNNARAFEHYSAATAGSMTVTRFLDTLLSKGPFAVGNEATAGPNGLGMSCVFYFGYISLLLFASSSVLCFKKIWKYLALFFFFMILAMGNNSPVDLFYLLWHLPLFSSIHEPARYFGLPMVFCFSIISGAVLNSSLFSNRNRLLKNTVYLICLYAVINMFTANSLYHTFTARMRIPPPKVQWKENSFFNVRTVPGSQTLIPRPDKNKLWERSYAPELGSGLQYFLLRQNIGLINWFGNITLEENAREKYRVTLGYGNYWKDLGRDTSPENGVLRNIAYRGECYFLDNTKENKIKDIKWGADRIHVNIDQSLPDMLIINQNYNKNWRTDRGNLINVNGLIGVLLENPGKCSIHLHYVPVSLFTGLSISIISLIFCILTFFFKRSR
jgi:hypothetical protein